MTADFPGRMTWVKHTNPIDITTWTWGDVDPTVNTVHGMNEILREQFEESPPDITFPFHWSDHNDDGYNGPAVSDPVMIYVGFPLGPNEEPCVYAASLEEVVDDTIEGKMNPQTKIVEDLAGQEICRKIAARLRELAVKLEKACQTEVKVK